MKVSGAGDVVRCPEGRGSANSVLCMEAAEGEKGHELWGVMPPMRSCMCGGSMCCGVAVSSHEKPYMITHVWLVPDSVHLSEQDVD